MAVPSICTIVAATTFQWKPKDICDVKNEGMGKRNPHQDENP